LLIPSAPIALDLPDQKTIGAMTIA